MREYLKKYVLIYFVEMLLIVSAFIGCFQKEETVSSIKGQELVLVTEEDGSGYYKSELPNLSPGVYRIRVNAAIPEDASAYVGLECETSTYNALRCNGAAIFQGQDFMEMEAYVLDTVDTGFMKCTFDQTDPISLTDLTVSRTNRGSVVFLFCAIAGSILVNLILWVRTRILTGKMNTGQQTAFWMLLLSVGLVYFPFATDYFDLGKETAFHLLRIEGLKDTLLQGGQFPARMQSGWLYGHGYGASIFYGDLFLLFPALLRIIGFSMMTAYKIFVLAVIGVTAVITYTCFGKCTKNTYSALFGTILYLMSPYLIYNYYVTGEAGEFLAMAFLPLICLGMYRIFTGIHGKGFSGKMLVIIGLTCVMQSHMPTFVLTSILLTAVSLILWKLTFRRETFLQLFQAAALTLLLNCWHWLPLLQMLGKDRYVLHDLAANGIQSKGTQLSGLLQPFPNMGNAGNGYVAEPVIMGTAVLLMFILYLFSGSPAPWKQSVGNKSAAHGQSTPENRYGRLLLLLLCIILPVIIMSTRYFPWDLLAGLPGLGLMTAALGSPVQLLSLVTVLCAMFGAFFAMWLYENDCHQRKIAARGILIFLSVTAIGGTVYQVNDIAYERNVIRLYTAENIGTTNVGRSEFMISGTGTDDYSYHGPVGEEGLEYSGYSKNGVNISIHVKNPGDSELHLELPLTGYKGYRLEGMGASGNLPYITETRGAHADLRIAVPAGYEGTLEIWYEGLKGFPAAEWISLITLAGILVFLIYKRRKACIS